MFTISLVGPHPSLLFESERICVLLGVGTHPDGRLQTQKPAFLGWDQCLSPERLSASDGCYVLPLFRASELSQFEGNVGFSNPVCQTQVRKLSHSLMLEEGYGMEQVGKVADVTAGC